MSCFARRGGVVVEREALILLREDNRSAHGRRGRLFVSRRRGASVIVGWTFAMGDERFVL